MCPCGVFTGVDCRAHGLFGQSFSTYNCRVASMVEVLLEVPCSDHMEGIPLDARAWL